MWLFVSGGMNKCSRLDYYADLKYEIIIYRINMGISVI